MKNDPNNRRVVKHKDKIRAHYEPRLSRHSDSYKILDWASPLTQRARFAVLADNVNLAGKSLLDVGCGLGDLRVFLRERAVPVHYTGVDISEKMVQAALKRQGDGKFLYADVFGDDPFGENSFDVVYCSGIFNLNLGNNRQFMAGAIGRLLRLTREHLVFNLLHERAASDDPKYFYHDPAHILELMGTFPCDVTLLDNYLPNDFTIIARKRP